MNDTLLACRVDTTHIASAVDAVRGIGWAHLRAALLLGVLAWTFTMLMELPRIVAFVTPFPVVVAQRLLDFELRTLCLMLAIVIADRADSTDAVATRFHRNDRGLADHDPRSGRVDDGIGGPKVDRHTLG